jgi:transcriptional regulator with XRE-family HTH domain
MGRARVHPLSTRFGRELRIARIASGLTQVQLGRLAETSQQEVSAAERGDPGVSLSVRCRLAAGCGHELGWRLYPVSGVSLRDSGQLTLANAIVGRLHASWMPHLEFPVAPRDARAADILLSHTTEVAEVEIERALVDFQAQLRAAQLKRQEIALHESRPVRLIVALPDSKAARQKLASVKDVLLQALPIPSRRIWAALRAGEPIGGDGLLFVRVRPGEVPRATAGRRTTAPNEA